MQRTEQEITVLYERYVDMVYRLCFTFLKNRPDTEDAVQNTFLKLIRHEKPFAGPDHEKAWLIVTASNTCRDVLRRAGRQDLPLEEGLLGRSDPHSDVLDAVLRLPELYRELVYLYYYEGYTGDEIASMVKRPASTVRNQLRDARSRLKKELGGDFDAE